MPYEVEMKAWVDDWAVVEARVRELCVFERSFRKEDRYFRKTGEASGEHQRLFRVRIDGETAYVTFKDKSVNDDAEINFEREFTVDDAAGFLELTERFGCEQSFAKVKEGLHFTRDGLTVELVHVHELGDFLEVEFVHGDSSADVHAAAVERIRSFIAAVGIESGRTEGRPYMQLLRDGASAED